MQFYLLFGFVSLALAASRPFISPVKIPFMPIEQPSPTVQIIPKVPVIIPPVVQLPKAAKGRLMHKRGILTKRDVLVKRAAESRKRLHGLLKSRKTIVVY